MKRYCLPVVAALVFLVTAAYATPVARIPVGMTIVPLASITNDRDTSISDLTLMLNDHGTVRGLYLRTRPSATSSPAQSYAQVYYLADIESPDGVVLGQGKGVKAIFLKGNIPPRGTHGSLVIRYLTNGIFRHYDQCRIGLQRLGPDDWRLVNAYNGRTVKHIEVETWALGISTIANVCPADAG